MGRCDQQRFMAGVAKKKYCISDPIRPAKFA